MRKDIKTEAELDQLRPRLPGQKAKSPGRMGPDVSHIYLVAKNQPRKPSDSALVYIISIIRQYLTAATDTLALALVTTCYSLLRCVTGCYMVLPSRALDLVVEAMATVALDLLDWQQYGSHRPGCSRSMVRSKPGMAAVPSSDLEEGRAPTSIKR